MALLKGRYRVVLQVELQRGSPGVQSSGFASPPASSFSGVHSARAPRPARARSAWRARWPGRAQAGSAGRRAHLPSRAMRAPPATIVSRSSMPSAAASSRRRASSSSSETVIRRGRRAPRARARGAAPRSRRRAARPGRPRPSGRAARGSAGRGCRARRRRARATSSSRAGAGAISCSGMSMMTALADRLGDGAAVEAVDLLRDALADHALDVGAQLGDRVELGDAAGELVVQRRELALLDACARAARTSRWCRRGSATGSRAGTSTSIVFSLAGAHADDAPAPSAGGCARRRARRGSPRRTRPAARCRPRL